MNDHSLSLLHRRMDFNINNFLKDKYIYAYIKGYLDVQTKPPLMHYS